MARTAADDDDVPEAGDGDGIASMRRTSCRKSFSETIFDIERGVMGSAVRWSPMTLPGDCATGEPTNMLRVAAATAAAAASARPAGGPSGEREAL